MNLNPILSNAPIHSEFHFEELAADLPPQEVTKKFKELLKNLGGSHEVLDSKYLFQQLGRYIDPQPMEKKSVFWLMAAQRVRDIEFKRDAYAEARKFYPSIEARYYHNYLVEATKEQKELDLDFETALIALERVTERLGDLEIDGKIEGWGFSKTKYVSEDDQARPAKQWLALLPLTDSKERQERYLESAGALLIQHVSQKSQPTHLLALANIAREHGFEAMAMKYEEMALDKSKRLSQSIALSLTESPQVDWSLGQTTQGNTHYVL